MPQRDPGNNASGRHDYSAETALDFAAHIWRRDYLDAMPAHTLAETIERARQIAAENPRSYLAKHLKRLYGVTR